MSGEPAMAKAELPRFFGKYPHCLINGRIPSAATVFTAKKGQRNRFRIINGGADAAFHHHNGYHMYAGMMTALD